MQDRNHQMAPGHAPHLMSAGAEGYYGAYFPAPEYAHDSNGRLGGIDVVGLFFRVLKYRWLVAAVVVSAMISAVFITLMQTPKYQAVAKLEVVLPSARVFQDIEVTTESDGMRAYQTAREKLKSRALAQRVVFALKLTDRPDFLFPRRNFSPMNLLDRAFSAGASAKRRNLPQDALVRIATSRIIANLQVSLVPNTSLLTIDYRDQNPKYAREIANQVAQSFIDQRVDQSGNLSNQAREFIQEQVVQVKEKLQESEKALVEYAKTAGITGTGKDESLIGSSMAEINQALSAAIQENLDYGRLVKQIEAGQGPSLQAVLQSEALDKLRGKLAELNGIYRQKLLLFKPDFPEMKQLKAQADEVRNQLDLGIRAITDGIRLKHEETIAKVSDLRTKLAELEADQAAYQDKNIQYTILKREVDSNRTQYESFIGKLNEVAAGSELKTQNAAIVDLAIEPSDPYSPRMPINLGIALILAASVAAGLIYILELVNNAFSNPDEVESELGLPVLGILPLVEEGNLQLQLSNPKSALSESYRSLRTSLQFSGVDGAPATLLVTSADPSEGKSTTVAKLADDLASLGAKVLIIDADMRKPSIHRIFNIDNAIGLSNLLMNTIAREDVPQLIRRSKNPNVFVMPAGTVPPNPADLLSSARMGIVLSSLHKHYNMIIIDGPPVIGIADVPILSRLTEATLLMVSTNKVARKSAVVAVKRLKSAGANLVGVALTMFATSKFDYNYNSNYSYLNYKYYGNAERLQPVAGVAGNMGAKSTDVSNWTFDSVVAGLRRHFGDFIDRIK
ncbi:polysaccharide biosynthesis tyrosine autokinase [uncultured Hoeflea sp.]|uniref:GumC family protein n=1 Tax=uncultured Hoeflea sp. TaxID=538666 RepID=UPI0030DBCB8C